MKKIILFSLTILLLNCCSSEKIISVKKDGRYGVLGDELEMYNFYTEKKKNSHFKCLLVGKSLSLENKILSKQILEFGLSKNIILLEQRTDIPALMNALDIHILSSYSEGFPNVIAEAMACGTPCVTTDVGDASFIVGDAGWVVPPSNPEALASSILTAIKHRADTLEWQKRKLKARQRIVDNFSIQKMVESYQKIWSA